MLSENGRVCKVEVGSIEWNGSFHSIEGGWAVEAVGGGWAVEAIVHLNIVSTDNIALCCRLSIVRVRSL